MPISDDTVALLRAAITVNKNRSRAFVEGSRHVGPGNNANIWPYRAIDDEASEEAIIRCVEQKLRSEQHVGEAHDRKLGEIAATTLLNELTENEVDRIAGARVLRFHERMSVSWGYIDRMSSTPLVREADAPVLYFALIALDKSHGGHGLIRENHHRGYHYHYVDGAKRRSDVLLSFGLQPPDPENPVTWERHGEGHATFSPNVDRWGRQKRESINRVCCRNAKKLTRAVFFTPSKNADFLLPM